MILQAFRDTLVNNLINTSSYDAEAEQSDYDLTTHELEMSHAISNKVISKRHIDQPFQSSPIKPRRELDTFKYDEVSEREKIKEFVDVKKMLLSLRNLEALVNDKNIDYTTFREEYIHSTEELFDAITNESRLDARLRRKNDYKDLIAKILLVSIEIIHLLLELSKPWLIWLKELGVELSNNEIFLRILNVVVELILMFLMVILDFLNSFKERRLKSRFKI